MSISFNQVRNSVIGYFGKCLREWFDTHLEYKLKEHFDKLINKNLQPEELKEYILDVYNYDYIEDVANDYHQFCFSRFLQQHRHNYKASVFINVWIDCCKWFEERYNIKQELLNEEQAWNDIAYWIIKKYLAQDWEELFIEKFEEEFIMYKDNNSKSSRIACGICWENKIIYTGCSTCKGNYLCYSCYTHLESNNTCPFCRCPEMVLNIEPPQIEDENTNTTFAYSVIPELIMVIENKREPYTYH